MNLRRRGHVVLLLLVGLGLLSATPARTDSARLVRPILATGSYFPLQPGSHWVYEKNEPPTMWEVSVPALAAATPQRLYQTLVGYFSGGREVRADTDGNVREWSGVGLRELLWYQLEAPVGTNWTLQLAPPAISCVSGAKLVVAERGGSLTVAAGTFRDVVRIDWTSGCIDGGIGSEWFAPGVGLIRRVEMTFYGPVASDLVRFDPGGNGPPRIGYATTLALATVGFVNTSTPPPGGDPLPTMRGYLEVLNLTEQVLDLQFRGCKSVAVEVRDGTGAVVAAGRGDDGGCCSCDPVLHVPLMGGAITVPFALRLAGPDAMPLPAGDYSVSATLETLSDASLRPTARAPIKVISVP